MCQNVSLMRRRESGPPLTSAAADAEAAEELQLDLRSDSAPPTAAPFSGRRRSGTWRKPPRGPLSGWLSSSEGVRRSSGKLAARNAYKRSLSDQHLLQPVQQLFFCDKLSGVSTSAAERLSTVAVHHF